MADEALVGQIEALLTSSQHAPMEDHDPRDGSCRSCPWPLHELSPREIARALLPEVRKAQAEAWDEGWEVAMHECSGDYYLAAVPVPTNPYRTDRIEQGGQS